MDAHHKPVKRVRLADQKLLAETPKSRRRLCVASTLHETSTCGASACVGQRGLHRTANKRQLQTRIVATCSFDGQIQPDCQQCHHSHGKDQARHVKANSGGTETSHLELNADRADQRCTNASNSSRNLLEWVPRSPRHIRTSTKICW
jgi:hypothetical protein